MRFPFRRRRRDEELDEELQSHLQMAIRDQMERGRTARQAEAAANRELGNVTMIKEVTRDMWGWGRVEQVAQDLRYAARVLIKNPAFTFIAVITLALGIGANTAIFTIVNGVLLKPLGYKEPDRLVKVWEKVNLFEKSSVAFPNFQDWRDQNRSFDKMAAYRGGAYTLTGIEAPEQIVGRQVSAEFLSVLGVAPALGRDFSPEEDRPGANLVVLISDGLWHRDFGGEPSVVGKTISLNNESYVVIGVLPADFHFYSNADIYATIRAKKNPALESRAARPGIQVIARLKHGVNLAQARSDMTAIARGLGERYPDTNKTNSITIGSLYDDIVGNTRGQLMLLLASVGFVLLIACANVANLLLARAAARQREIAVRSALGASRFRITRMLVTESVLLALVGGGLGLLTAFLGTGLAIKALPQALPRSSEIAIDGRVLLFTIAVSILTGLLFGLVPALQTSKPELNETLKDGGRTSSGGGQSLRSAMVIAEVALALVLLVGTGLLVRSFIYLSKVNPGFEPKNVLSFRVALPPARYPDTTKIMNFYREFTDLTGKLPGVQAVGATTLLPLGGDDNESPFYITGRPAPELSEMPEAMFYVANPGYLQAMRIPLLRGRFFDERDSEKPISTALGLAVIDETMAQQYFSGEDPIGQRISFPPGFPFPEAQIIGVIGHVKQQNLDTTAGAIVQPQIYLPFSTQLPSPVMNMVIRTNADPLGYVSAIRSQLKTIDPNQAISNVTAMEEVVSESISDRRFAMLLAGLFSLLALVLATIGIYGVMSYTVTQRIHEFGIRLALGAGRGDMLALVLGGGAKLALIGIGIGTVGALILTRFISTFLFGVSPSDPLTFASIAVFLTGITLIASFMPARRAMKVDPITALRYE